MRLFLLTLCSLSVLVLAKPQQGYNYGAGQSGTIGGGSFGFNAARGPSGGSASFVGAPSGQVNFVGQHSQPSAVHQGGSGYGAANGGGFSGFSGSNVGFDSRGGYQQQSGSFEAPLVHKQFITISAPEDHDSLEQTKHLVIGRPQKNYRVVFIKAPSSSNANVKLSAEYAPKEEKTVIYVLSKKDSTLEVNDIATPAPTVPSKPEVFFIKYKTDAEAQHAQQQIQAEYDRIEGTSEHTDGGVAPQQSVVGILDGSGAGSSSGSIVGSGSSLHGSSATISGFSSKSGSDSLGGGIVSFGSGSQISTSQTSYLPPAH